MRTPRTRLLALAAVAGATFGLVLPGAAHADSHLTGDPLVVLGDHEPDASSTDGSDEFGVGFTETETFSCADAGCVTGSSPRGLSLDGDGGNANQDSRSVAEENITFTLVDASVVQIFLAKFGLETNGVKLFEGADDTGDVVLDETASGAGEGVYSASTFSEELAAGTYTLQLTVVDDEIGDGYHVWDQIAISADRVIDCGGFHTESDAADAGYNVVYIGDGDTPTGGDDLIIGTEEADEIFAGGGDDIVCALGGDDTVNGNAGDDVIFGGEGIDTVNGNAGDDTIDGGEGDDDLRGGRDDDAIEGGAGDDVIKGDLGDDDLSGGEGNDVIHGDNPDNGTGEGDDKLTGGAGDDELYGGAGNDNLVGSAGDDVLDGGEGTRDKGNGSAGYDVCDVEREVGKNCEA